MFSAKRAPEDLILTDEDDDSFERIDDLYHTTESQESAESELHDYDDEMNLLKSELTWAKKEIDRLSKENEGYLKSNKISIIFITIFAIAMVMLYAYSLSFAHRIMEKECEQKLIEEMSKYRSCPQMEYHFENLERKLKEAEEWRARYEKQDNCATAQDEAKIYREDELLQKKVDELLKQNDEKKKEEERRASYRRKTDDEFMTFVAGAFIVMLVSVICMKIFSPKEKKSFEKSKTALVAANDESSKTRARQEEDMNIELEMHAEHTEKLRIELDNLKKKQAEIQIAAIVEKPDDKVVKPEETTYVTEKEITANVASEINQAVLEMLERMEMLENKLFAITP